MPTATIAVDSGGLDRLRGVIDAYVDGDAGDGLTGLSLCYHLERATLANGSVVLVLR
jgi:hypothetical protein